MKITIWSDYVCPFCYIGKRHLDIALNELQIQADIEFKSFELDPDFEPVPGIPTKELLARKRGFTVEEARAHHQQLKAIASHVGLDYDYDRTQYSNTLKVHRLTQYAKSVQKDAAFAALALDAYFAQGVSLIDDETLITLAKKAGLDEQAARSVITSNAYENKVRQDEDEAQAQGISGVPYFLINGIPVSGAQSVDVFKQVLQTAVQPEKPSASCQGSQCDL